VTLADQTTFDAAGGRLPDRDLAVLRIDAPKDKLPPIAMGTSRDLIVGQRVYAIGNPFGLDQTLTTGIVSALNREIESFNNRTIRGVIQTDAAINPGNSGGPLLDSAGRLIGVNTQIASPSGASAGIGFAIPVDEVNRIVPRLIRDGRFVRPAIGVSAGPPGLGRR
jgi:S1-C subfamily serine protease